MFSRPTLVAVGAITLLVMLGLGATLTLADFRRALTDKRGIGIGLASQYGWMPLLGYTAAVAADLPDELAIGLLLMTCASGGNASNMFSWFSKADVALSVSMTAISSILSVVAMPLLLGLYSGRFTDAELHMPYVRIVGTLVGMMIPLGLGMLLRAKRPDLAAKIERPAKWAGGVVILIIFYVGADDLVANIEATDGAMLLSSLSVAASGIILGFLAARVGGLPTAQQRAVAFETGIQNFPVVIAVVLASFPDEQQGEILLMPLVYAVFALVMAGIITIVMLTIDKLQSPASNPAQK